ncbi:transposase [Streptomyces sp. NPDC127051]|uniref:IS110 family transposase n=1 Tax=Streptomyces sp. NPDC127051 TaxID=3347119 RepID=UPI00364616F9
MMLIGIDPHKSTHTATAVDPGTNRDHASMRIDVSLEEYQRMPDRARQWPGRRWAVENARGLGHHLASWLPARGEEVVRVPPSATARVRQLSRGAGRKNDRIDAAAAACAAALQGDARPVQPESSTDALALLDERHSNLAQAGVRAVNQLHALLRALLPGGAPRGLSAAKAEQLPESAVPAGPAETTRHTLAAGLVAEVRAWDVKLKDNAKAMAPLVAESGSRLTGTPGIGAV